MIDEAAAKKEVNEERFWRYGAKVFGQQKNATKISFGAKQKSGCGTEKGTKILIFLENCPQYFAVI